MLRHADIVQELQRDHAVAIVGPTTLAAFINSLRMGFRTLAIERRSSEVWEVLGAVKTEFRKFGDVVDRVKKQIATASHTLDDTSTRTRAMERRLRSVEELPIERSIAVLGLVSQAPEDLTDLDEAPSGDDLPD